MAVLSPGKGREAVSEFKTLEAFEDHTLLEFSPKTGRTHQIRLHCAFLGCPIVGDKIYGRRKSSVSIKRHFLHAHKLKIMLPEENEASVFVANLPIELEQVLNELRH
jgi:23S rRNA pseudouridine1911/1915/1917 synthase